MGKTALTGELRTARARFCDDLTGLEYEAWSIEKKEDRSMRFCCAWFKGAHIKRFAT
jgi:hypothetical protein